MEGHQWSASDMGCASVITIPRENDAERDTPTTCPVDITSRDEWNAVGDDRNNTLPSETGVNAGWRPPSSVIPIPNSYMPADNLTEDPTADAWYSMPWTTEPCSWETLPASFWGCTWPQSGYLAGSETDGFLHPSIPVEQSAGWPFGSEAKQPQYATRSGTTPFWVDHSQELFHLGPSPDLPEPIPSSVAARLSSMPPNIPNLHRVQQAEDVSLSFLTDIPMQLPS
ncbi:similar to An03g03090 [Aspergillus luchuensis IFO 4308]|nr:similar to An03g03090 [Aspergillus luchuensis IFO 4308]